MKSGVGKGSRVSTYPISLKKKRGGVGAGGGISFVQEHQGETLQQRCREVGMGLSFRERVEAAIATAT